MKKWQKILGCFVFCGLIGVEILLYSWAVVAWEPTPFYKCIALLANAMWLNLALALFLFICLWRKEETNKSLSVIDRLTLELRRLGINSSEYAFNDISKTDCMVLYNSGVNYRIIYVDDRGIQKIIASFSTEEKACDYVLDYFKKSVQVRKKYHLSN